MNLQPLRAVLTPPAACLLLLLFSSLPRPTLAADPPQMASTYGTIVSVRQNILEIRPPLRHAMERVSVSDKTNMTSFKDVTKAFLKPGMRLYVMGDYAEKSGMQVSNVYATEKAIDILAEKSHGLTIDKEHHFARCIANLKSVEPFVFTDDDGKDFPATLGPKCSFTNVFRGSINSLMIGMTIQAMGPRAPDGVIQAASVYPIKDFTKPGTMFGKVLSVDGGVLKVQPRYSSNTITITLAPGSTIQQQMEVDADSVKIGDPVSFWARYPEDRGHVDKKGDPLAIALIIGKEGYPAILADPDLAMFVTGKLSSLDPVQVALADGKHVTVVVPALMPIARVITKSRTDLKPGAQAMFLLTPHGDSGFQAQAVILDASPWLGYGM